MPILHIWSSLNVLNVNKRRIWIVTLLNSIWGISLGSPNLCHPKLIQLERAWCHRLHSDVWKLLLQGNRACSFGLCPTWLLFLIDPASVRSRPLCWLVRTSKLETNWSFHSWTFPSFPLTWIEFRTRSLMFCLNKNVIIWGPPLLWGKLCSPRTACIMSIVTFLWVFKATNCPPFRWPHTLLLFSTFICKGCQMIRQNITVYSFFLEAHGQRMAETEFQKENSTDTSKSIQCLFLTLTLWPLPTLFLCIHLLQHTHVTWEKAICLFPASSVRVKPLHSPWNSLVCEHISS